MGSPAIDGQRSGRCTCGRDLDAIAAHLREALAIVERSHSYEQGVADWAQQARTFQRTQRPQQRASAGSGPGAPRAAAHTHH